MNIQLILMYYTLVIHPGSGVVYLIAGHHTDPAPMNRKSSFSTPEIQNEVHCFFFYVLNLRVGSRRGRRQSRNSVAQRGVVEATRRCDAVILLLLLYYHLSLS